MYVGKEYMTENTMCTKVSVCLQRALTQLLSKIDSLHILCGAQR